MSEKPLNSHFIEGKRYLKEQNLDRALRAFGKAYRSDRDNPYYMSYYGLLKALRGGEIGLGLELCTMAIKREFHKAEFYLNLGRIYLAAGNKKGAVSVFKKGLNFDPSNEELNRHLSELGVRKRPVIPALDRSNPLNKFLGVLFRRRLPNFMKRLKT